MVEGNKLKDSILRRCEGKGPVSIWNYIKTDKALQAELIRYYIYTGAPQNSFRKERAYCEDFMMELFSPFDIDEMEAIEISEHVLATKINKRVSFSYAGEVEMGAHNAGSSSTIEFRRIQYNPYDKFTTWKHFPMACLVIAWIVSALIIRRFCPDYFLLYLVGFFSFFALESFGMNKKSALAVPFGNLICAGLCALDLCYHICEDYFHFTSNIEGYFGIVVLVASFLVMALLFSFYETKFACISGAKWETSDRVQIG